MWLYTAYDWLTSLVWVRLWLCVLIARHAERVIRASSPLCVVCESLVLQMALRPSASPFTPGTGGSQPSSVVSNKQSSFINSSLPSPSAASSVSQSIPNKGPSRPPAKTKGLPRGNQAKRGQTRGKFEKKGRFADEALTADPVIETVLPRSVIRVLIPYR